MKRLIAVVLGGIFVGSMTLLLIFFRDAQQGDLAFEAGKALLQVGVVAVAGAVVSVLIFEYQRERQATDREKEDARHDKEKQADIDREANEKQRDLDRKSLEYRETLLLSILARAMESYAKTKKARRLLRGRAILTTKEGKVVIASQYDICFDLLNEAQMDFENIARDISTSSMAFSDPKKTAKDLNTMDSYLNDLVGEYEEQRNRFLGEIPSLALSELPLLAEFQRPARESKFKDDVVIPYHDVQYAIRDDLLHPNLPRKSPVSDLDA